MELRRSLFWGRGRGCDDHWAKSTSGSNVEDPVVRGPWGAYDIVV